MVRQDERFDGQFDYEGETICYKIVDSSTYEIKEIKGVEKLARQIHFYNNGVKKGWHLIYDYYEIVSNINSSYALEQYKTALKNGEIE